MRRDDNNPYRGPQPLTVDDTIFGRDRELAELESLLLSQRIVLLYAASGVGKTSLLQAGLCDVMKDRGFEIANVVGFRSHTAADVVPGSNRYEAAVVAALGQDPATARLLDVLDDEAIEDGRWLLVLDQFEELFTVDRTDWPAKNAFMATLARVLASPKRWAVIAFREEYIAELDAFVDLFPGDLSTRIRLEPLSSHEAVKAIVGPAEARGISFDIHLARDIARLLSAVEVDLTAGRAVRRQADSVEPIHLQLVCHRLWHRWRERFPEAQRITAVDVEKLDFVEDLDDVERVFADYYDEVIGEATAAGSNERALRDWFETLVTDERHRAPAQYRPAGPRPTVEFLESRYLVRRALGSGGERYELAHDRLVPAIISANAERLAALEPLHSKTKTWSQNRHQAKHLSPDDVALLEQVASEHVGLVSDEERTYIRRSQEKRHENEEEQKKIEEELNRIEDERKKATRRRIFYGVFLLAIVLLAFLWFSTAREAGESMRERDAIQRTGEALLEEELDPGLALRMVIDAADELPRQQALPAQVRSVLYRFSGATPTRSVLRDAEGVPQLGTAVATAQQGSLKAVGTVDGTVLVFSGSGSAPPETLDGLTEPIREIVVAANGSLLGAVDASGAWAVWQSQDDRWVKRRYPEATDLAAVSQLAMRPDGSAVLALSAGGETLVDLDAGESIPVPMSTGVTASGNTIALWSETAGTDSPSVVTIDSRGEQGLPSLDGSPTVAALSSTGEQLALGTQDGRVFVASSTAGPRPSTTSHDGPVHSLHFVSVDEVISGAHDGVIVWRVEPTGPREIRRISSRSAALLTVVPARTRSLVTALTELGTIEDWAVTVGHEGRVAAMAASVGSVLSLGEDGSLLRWTGDAAANESASPDGVAAVDGLAQSGTQHVVLAGERATVFVGRSETNIFEAGVAGNPTALALGAGPTVAVGDDTGMLLVRSPATSASTVLEAPITALGFNSAGSELLVATADGRAVIYETETLTEVASLSLRSGMGTAVAVLPADVLRESIEEGEEVLVVGESTGSVTVWLRSVLTSPAARTTQAGSVTGIGGDPDTGRLLTTSTTGQLNIWAFADGEPEAYASIRLPQPITAFASDGNELWVGDSSGLVTRVPATDDGLRAYSRAVSSWEAARDQICQRRDWLIACPLDEERAAELLSVRRALEQPIAATAAEPNEPAPQVQASPELMARLGELVERYAAAIDDKSWDTFRQLTGRSDLEDSALEVAYGTLESFDAALVSVQALDSETARLAVGVVEGTSIDGDGQLVASCTVWIAHHAEGTIEEVPDTTNTIAVYTRDLPSHSEIFETDLQPTCGG